VTDERFAVRHAARAALARFGRNAIWQVRERYLNATGKDADPSWSYQRVVSELYRLHDEPKQRAFEAALERASAALQAGDPSAAEAALNGALADNPQPDDVRRAAHLYAQLAERALTKEQLEHALTLYRRALRLDPEAESAAASRARIAYLEAELRLAQGIADMHSYAKAATLDPSLEPALAALDELTGARRARDAERRRYLGLAAAVLMALAGFFLLRRPRELAAEPPVNDALSSEPIAGTPAAETDASAKSVADLSA
jgi:tetratricopeptide (TPR) repeat protein